jgi:DNA modification methylase
MTYTRKEVIGPHTLYLGDCRDILLTLGKVDAVVTDPPYGLGDLWTGGKAHTKTQWKLSDGGSAVGWDREISADAIAMAVAIARDSIIWGGQYYNLPPRRGWLVWDKIFRNFSSGHCELAWTTLEQPVRAFNYANAELAAEGKVHPTQKPLPLMLWCLGYLPSAKSIVDPFMGSGTTLVACQRLGRAGIGIEIDRRYFDIACRRVEAAVRQPDLFVSSPETAQQLDLLEAS